MSGGWDMGSEMEMDYSQKIVFRLSELYMVCNNHFISIIPKKYKLMMNFLLLRKVEDLICADKSWIVLVPLML